MNLTSAPSPNPTLLRTDDRCDRCSAAARVLVLLHAGGELVFCHHHANKYRTALEPGGVIIEHREEPAR
jgi:hypothetical protein